MHSLCRRAVPTIVAAVLAAAPLAAQQPARTTLNPCRLVTVDELRRLGMSPKTPGVRDSTGMACTWGRPETMHALVVKYYPVLELATLERMRITAATTSDQILEPTLAPGAWSVGKSFGRVLMVSQHGQGLQLRFYVAPHSKGADRVDVRATEADRQKLLAVGQRVITRL